MQSLERTFRLPGAKGKQQAKDCHLGELFEAFKAMRRPEDIEDFLEDLCTPAELRSMTDRWRVAKLLQEGLSYRLIHEKTGVSTATITRVARSLSYGAGGYQKVLDRLYGEFND